MEKQRLVATYQLKEIVVSSGPSFRFRIEIYQDEIRKLYSAKIYRLEFLRVQPTFPQTNGNPVLGVADEEIWVLDHSLITDDHSAKSEQECLDTIEKRLNEVFQ